MDGAEFDTQLPLRRVKAPFTKGASVRWVLRFEIAEFRIGLARLIFELCFVFGRKLKKTSRKACFFYKGVENCLRILALRYLFEAEPISGRSIGNIEILIDFGVFDNASRFKAQVLSFLYGNFSALYLKSTGLRSFCVKQYI